MDLTQHLSDDQTALIGCALALLASGGLMWSSYFVGRALRRESRESAVSAPTIPLAAPGRGASGETEHRRAA